jgi:hypothetical protein
MGANTDRVPTTGLGRVQHWCYTRAAPLWRVVALVPPLAGAALVGWSGSLADKCSDAHLAIAFGIHRDRVLSLTAAECSADATLTTALLVDSAGAALYGIGLSVLLLVWWRYGWRSGSQRTFRVARAVSFIPLAAGGCDIIENIAGLFATPTTAGLKIPEAAAQVAATAGLAKWLLVVGSVFAVIFTLYGAWRFRALRLTENEPKPRPESCGKPPPVHGAAVCLSGGGIRSASFSWGALSHLSAAGLFVRLRSMYSVSGGGYAATAWTSSAGFAAPDSFYRVVDDHDPTAPPTAAFQHVRRNHRYLDSRRGGLSLALVKTLLSILVNLSVIYAGIIVTASLPAVLAGSEFGLVVSEPGGGAVPGTIRAGVWLPGLWLAAVAAAIVGFSWLPRTAAGRRPLLIVASALLAGAVAIVTITVVLPWIAHRQDDLWRASWWATVPALVTWTIGLVAAFLRPRLSTMAIRLGGVLGIVLVAYTFIGVVRNASVENSNWKYALGGVDSSSSVVTWLLLMAAAIAWLVMIDHTGVQWWSLHPLYRDRMATTFAIRRRKDGMIKPRPDAEWPRWSQLSASRKPNHIVCAATHRRARTVTGLRAVSYRFSRDGVGYFEPDLDGAAIDIREFSADADWLDRSFGLTPRIPAEQRRFRKPHARSTAMAAAAISGAAFNSAMGRQSKGSTDSLLAMLNLRLGVWMPNHRFATHPEGDRIVKWPRRAADIPRPFPRPGLRYLFHEVIGHYDLADPFIQVSDGGHWENLGLAEALRDRHRTIIVVDATGGRVEPASAGPAGTGFASLHEATDVARIEMATEVRIDVTPMRPDPRTGRATQNWASGTIVYHRDREHDWRSCTDDPRCAKGTLLFVKAVICDRTPADVLAYANTDRVFPDYPTGDQFLSDNQFDALVRLGRSAIEDALKHPPHGPNVQYQMRHS